MPDIDTKPTAEVAIPAKVELYEGRATLVPLDSRQWLSELSKVVGQCVVVRLERPKLRHSDAQVGYYRGVVLKDILSGLKELAVDVGERCPWNTTDELHEAFKYMFLEERTVRSPTPSGHEAIRLRPTTTILTTGEYSDYIEKIIRWAGERGIPVRLAGEDVRV